MRYALVRMHIEHERTNIVCGEISDGFRTNSPNAVRTARRRGNKATLLSAGLSYLVYDVYHAGRALAALRHEEAHIAPSKYPDEYRCDCMALKVPLSQGSPTIGSTSKPQPTSCRMMERRPQRQGRPRPTHAPSETSNAEDITWGSRSGPRLRRGQGGRLIEPSCELEVCLQIVLLCTEM